MAVATTLSVGRDQYTGFKCNWKSWTTISLLPDGEKFTSKSIMAGIEVETKTMFSP
jgi:hypothetical protein